MAKNILPQDSDISRATLDATKITCCELDDWTSFQMLPLAGTILHEFLHWEYLTSELGYQIGDWNSPAVPNALPPNGYGPYNCQLVGANGEEFSLRNADNYVWYALEVYWRKVCPNRPFEPPRPRS